MDLAIAPATVPYIRTPGEVRSAGPDLGAQTLAVLSTLLGLDADQLAALQDRKVI